MVVGALVFLNLVGLNCGRAVVLLGIRLVVKVLVMVFVCLLAVLEEEGSTLAPPVTGR